MARLNEAPLGGASTSVGAGISLGMSGAESLEALRRRFMRQNRELAKANSELKIKVATLEADRAQLLSENITLRDRNNHLTQEASREHYSSKAIKNVGLVREKLVLKVAELSALMIELDIVPAKVEAKEKKDNLVRRKSFKRSPTRIRNWKNSLCGPEVTGLEPIVEGKQYPRKTLSADEIREILPELGTIPDSPQADTVPVTILDTYQQVAEDETQQKPTEEKQIEMPTEKHTEQSATPLANTTESRRKRRTSALLRESTEQIKSEGVVAEAAKTDNPEPLLKIGAKRKFDLGDDDDTKRSGVPDHTSFSFSRKSGTTSETQTNRPVKPLPERKASQVAERARNIVGEVKARKALGEKAVNTDPVVSPVKLRATSEKSERPELLEKVKERQKIRQPMRSDSTTDKRVPKPLELPPATPVPVEIDLFSPTESITSAHPGPRDTPPPSELTSKSAENTRPSRRQRAQVSYTEPSLRDKMRRPGKELADAVITGKTTKDGSQTANLKDAVGIANWVTLSAEARKDMAEPPSPLQSKSSGAEESLPSTVATDRRRKSSVRTDGFIEVTLKQDASKSDGSLISSQRRLSRARDTEIKNNETSSSELLDSSSPESFGQKGSSLTKQARRHSSIADVKSKKEAIFANQKGLTGSDADSLSAGRADRIASRRRSMQL